MIKRLNSLVLLILILTIGLMACTGTATNNDASEALPPVVGLKAREMLSADLNIGENDIEIVTSEQVTWSDSCLGLGGIAESCLQAEVSGWRIELLVDGTSYYAHTDELGEQVRFEHKRY